jgi:hypothetical protein
MLYAGAAGLRSGAPAAAPAAASAIFFEPCPLKCVGENSPSLCPTMFFRYKHCDELASIMHFKYAQSYLEESPNDATKFNDFFARSDSAFHFVEEMMVNERTISQ